LVLLVFFCCTQKEFFEEEKIMLVKQYSYYNPEFLTMEEQKITDYILAIVNKHRKNGIISEKEAEWMLFVKLTEEFDKEVAFTIYTNMGVDYVEI